MSSDATVSSPVDRPLTRASVLAAHELIKPHIHRTPVLTCQTLDRICSSPRGTSSAAPKLNLFLKCENLQKIGAFKYRGATHSLTHLLNGTSSLPGTSPSLDRQTLAKAGVITHSSGNHAQALALAAHSFGIPATIVMPKISTPAKIAATKGYGANVIFSGSTGAEREAVVSQVMAEKPGIVLVPPYDAIDIILGQGTAGLELAEQASEIIRERNTATSNTTSAPNDTLDAVISPVGGGGLLSGLALSFADTGTRVFGAEPSFQGADDCKRGLESQPPQRIEHVSSLTIADGVRTPVGKIPWSIISNPEMVRGVFSVGEEEIARAMRLLWERAKIVVEPTAALGVAVALFDEEFRGMVQREMEREGKREWNLGVVLTGGNVDLAAAGELLARGAGEWEVERGLGRAGLNGEREPLVQGVAG